MCEHGCRLGGRKFSAPSAYRASEPRRKTIPPTGFCFGGATFRPINRAQSEMLSQGTNQARRGSGKRNDPPRGGRPLAAGRRGRSHKTEREASCDQDNPNTSADLEPVKLQLWLANSIWVDMLQRTLPAGFIAPCLPTKTGHLWPNRPSRSRST